MPVSWSDVELAFIAIIEELEEGMTRLHLRALIAKQLKVDVTEIDAHKFMLYGLLQQQCVRDEVLTRRLGDVIEAEIKAPDEKPELTEEELAAKAAAKVSRRSGDRRRREEKNLLRKGAAEIKKKIHHRRAHKASRRLKSKVAKQQLKAGDPTLTLARQALWKKEYADKSERLKATRKFNREWMKANGTPAPKIPMAKKIKEPVAAPSSSSSDGTNWTGSISDMLESIVPDLGIKTPMPDDIMKEKVKQSSGPATDTKEMQAKKTDASDEERWKIAAADQNNGRFANTPKTAEKKSGVWNMTFLVKPRNTIHLD
jgi:hypothetical protein